MIIYDLACEQEHTFEGWFNSPADYDSQLQDSLIACPRCGSSEIRRIPSAPHFSKSADVIPAAQPAAPAQPEPTPQGVEQVYQQLMAAIVASCEDVGSDFADEARKMHYMETPQRSILGQASAQDYEDLREEGIDVLRLPVLKKH